MKFQTKVQLYMGLPAMTKEQAQEYMWGLMSKRDALQRLLDATDKELASVFSEMRELLMDFPTLSLKARK